MILIYSLIAIIFISTINYYNKEIKNKDKNYDDLWLRFIILQLYYDKVHKHNENCFDIDKLPNVDKNLLDSSYIEREVLVYIPEKIRNNLYQEDESNKMVINHAYKKNIENMSNQSEAALKLKEISTLAKIKEQILLSMLLKLKTQILDYENNSSKNKY